MTDPIARLPFGESDGNVQTIEVTLHEGIDDAITMATVFDLAEQVSSTLERAGLNVQDEVSITLLRGRTKFEVAVFANRADANSLLRTVEAIFRTSVVDRLAELNRKFAAHLA